MFGVGVDLDGFVAVGYLLFEPVLGHDWQVAVGLFREAAVAGVVEVLDALAVDGSVDDESPAAVAAVDGGFEVVVVFAGSFALSSGGQDGLDFVEEFFGDKWRVVSGEEDAFVVDDSGVVRVL